MQNRTLSTFIVVRIHARICVSFIVIWSFYAIFADAHFDYLMTKFMKILNYIFKFDPWLPCCMTFTGLDNLIMWSYDSNSTFRPSKMVKLILFGIHKPAFPKLWPIKNFWICGHNVLMRRCKFDKWLHFRLTDRAVVTAADHSYAFTRVRNVALYIWYDLKKGLLLRQKFLGIFFSIRLNI